MWITFNTFSTIFEVFMPYFYLHCTNCIIPKSLLNHPNSFHRAMFKLNTKLMQICCSAHSVIWNVKITQCTSSINGMYCPHWLVQWSHPCSCMCIPVHSPRLPGCIHAVQTILILTMSGLFLDRPSNWGVGKWWCIIACVVIPLGVTENYIFLVDLGL